MIENSSRASAHPNPLGARPSARDVYELLRLPALIAVPTAAVTWLIWYYTSTSCTPELASLVGCNPSAIARYINVDIYGRILTYSAITGAMGGVWNYDMFTKMRAAIAAEQARADEAVQQLAEYRQQAEEERRLRYEERRQERERIEEQRLQSEERRRQEWERIEEQRLQSEERRRQEHEAFMAMLAEERRQSTENQQAFMATLSEMTAQVARLVERQNGNGQDGH